MIYEDQDRAIEIIANHRKQQERERRKVTEEQLQVEENARKNSITQTKTAYKPKKKNVKLSLIAAATAVAISITSISLAYGIGSGYKRYEDIITKQSIDKYMITMIAPETNYRNIISYIKESTNNPKDYYHNEYWYNTDVLSREIIKCDYKYIDIIIYNAYDNMLKETRNMNMDKLIYSLRNYTSSLEETYPEIYYKFHDISSFDEYLIKIGCVDKNNNPSIEKYEKYGRTLYTTQMDSLSYEVGGMKL